MELDRKSHLTRLNKEDGNKLQFRKKIKFQRMNLITLKLEICKASQHTQILATSQLLKMGADQDNGKEKKQNRRRVRLGQ